MHKKEASITREVESQYRQSVIVILYTVKMHQHKASVIEIISILHGSVVKIPAKVGRLPAKEDLPDDALAKY